MLSHEQLQDMAAQLFEEHLDGKNDDPSLALARAVEAATLAAVTPLVQQLVNALEQADADSQEVLGNYGQLYSERYRPQRLEWQEGVVAWNAKAMTAARAFLSGATKESIDHG